MMLALMFVSGFLGVLAGFACVYAYARGFASDD